MDGSEVERTTETCLEEGEGGKEEGGKNEKARGRVKWGRLRVFVEHLNLSEHKEK